MDGAATKASGAVQAVFVYGTLLPGEQRSSLLERFASHLEPATTPGRLFDTGRGYPAAVFGDSPSLIPGMRVTVAADRWHELIDLLDRVEDEGRLYRRVEIDTSAGRAVSYEWIGDTEAMRHLPDGWVQR